jgi:ribose transport system substrate-binding protein
VRSDHRGRRGRVLRLAAICACVAGAAAVAVSQSGGATARTNAAKLYVAGVSPFSNDPTLIPTSCGAGAVFKKAGYKWTWGGPTGADVPGEISFLNNISLLKPAGIVLLPLSPTAFNQKVKSLMQEGVPIDMTDGNLTPFVAHRSYQSDFSTAGKLVTQGVLRLTGGSGTVGVIGLAPGLKQDADRFDPAIKLLKTHAGIKVLPVQYAAASTVKSAAIAGAMIRGNPDLKVIIASNGPEAIGAASAVLSSGSKGKVKIIAFDSPAQVLTAIRQGTIDYTIAQAPYLKGVYAARDILRYIKQHGVRSGPVPVGTPSIVLVPTKVLNAQNIDTAAAKPYLDSPNCSAFNGINP